MEQDPEILEDCGITPASVRRSEEILAAAERFFAQRGYRQTDVQEIADALGVGKGTVYRCFPTKEDLFLKTVDRSMRRLQDRMRQAVDQEPDPMKRFARGVRAYLGFFDENPQVIELLILERAEFRDRTKPTYFEYREANFERRRVMVEQLIAEGRLRQMPADRLLDVLCDLLYGTIFTSHYLPRRKSLEKQVEDILDILMNGILPRHESSGPPASAGGSEKDRNQR